MREGSRFEQYRASTPAPVAVLCAPLPATAESIWPEGRADVPAWCRADGRGLPGGPEVPRSSDRSSVDQVVGQDDGGRRGLAPDLGQQFAARPRAPLPPP